MSLESVVIASLLLINTLITMVALLIARRYYGEAVKLLQRIHPDYTPEKSSEHVRTRVDIKPASFAARV